MARSLLSLNRISAFFWRKRCECVQVTEIRQASPFSETRTSGARVSQRPAGDTSAVFELPSADRAAEVRQNAPRPNPVRDAAHARNAVRDVARDAAKAERPQRSPAAKDGHGHAHDGVRGAKRAAEAHTAGAADGVADQADKDCVACTDETQPQDLAAEASEGVAASGEGAVPVEAVAAELTQEALAELQGIAGPPAPAPVQETSIPADQATNPANPGPALTDGSAAETAAALLAVVPQPAADNAGVAAEKIETAQPAVAEAGNVSPKLATTADAGNAGGEAEEMSEDSSAGEADNASHIARAKAESEAKHASGKADKDQLVPAAEGKSAPEAKPPADVPAVARDSRFELPSGMSFAAPKAAHDLHSVAGAEQVPNGQPHVAESRPTPINAVPLEIGLRAMAGNKRFDIRLDPAELGRVDVRLDIDDAGIVTAKLTVDRVETLHLLQRDARTLERAFEQAGLRPSDGGVDISLRDQSGQQGSNQAGRDESEQNSRRSRAFLHVEPEIAEAQAIRRTLGPGRIDLSI